MCCGVLSSSDIKDIIQVLLASIFSLDIFNHEEAVCCKQERLTALHCSLFLLGFVSIFIYITVPDSEKIVFHLCMVINPPIVFQPMLVCSRQ